MSESTSDKMKTAFNVIDAVTMIKGVNGAMLVDGSGVLLADDFGSTQEHDQFLPLGTELLPQLVEATKNIGMDELNNVVLQTTQTTIRFYRREKIWLEVFADEDVNIGMMNVDLRELDSELLELGGGSVVDERANERAAIRAVMEAEGNLDSLIAERQADLDSLRALQGTLFQMTTEAGVSKGTISQRINDINYRIYRDSLVDIGLDFFNRKTLDNYDPQLARTVLTAQIKGFEQMMKEAAEGRVK